MASPSSAASTSAGHSSFGFVSRWIDGAFVHEQFLHLRVAVLLHDEDLVMRIHEGGNFLGKRKGADAQRIEMQILRFERRQRLFHRYRGRAVIDRAKARGFLCGPANRRRRQSLRRFELAQQALHLAKRSCEDPRVK